MQTPEAKAQALKLLILDVDGILTSGVIYYGNDGMQFKGFHVHDGLGIKLLQKAGITVAVISAKKTSLVVDRLKELGIEHAYLGHEQKLPVYQTLQTELGLSDQQIGYMGDDLPDLPVLRRVGFAATVPQAPAIIKQHVDYISNLKAGKGAVREVCEFILRAQGKYESMIQSYLD